jgi:hypothetical protein
MTKLLVRALVVTVVITATVAAAFQRPPSRRSPRSLRP